MKKKDNVRKIKKAIEYSKGEIYQGIILIIVAIFIVTFKVISTRTFKLSDYFDTTFVGSVLFAFFCEISAVIVSKTAKRIHEDKLKLETNYKLLVNKYSLDKSKMVYIEKEKIYLPEILLIDRKISSNPFIFLIELDDKNPKYNLPTRVADNSELVFCAHEFSEKYNNKNIRLNNLTIDGNKELKLQYSFTTYYDSLLTNRAMDYEFKTDLTVRNIYEPGPFISKLTE